MKENDSKEIVCTKCDVELLEDKVNFSYLDRKFSGVVMKCPICGKVFISEELVDGKIKDIESMFESK